jgi:hypothetical protein
VALLVRDNKHVSNRRCHALVELGRIQRLMLQPDPITGLDDADVSAVRGELLRVVLLAGQVAKQAALTNALLPHEHELGPVQPLLASQQRGVVGLDRGPALP